jgi:ribosomal protein S18 acetylase RimI-like enzyme
MNIRRATPSDIPAIARLTLCALADDPQWKAFFPRKLQTDPAFLKYCESILGSYLEPANEASWLVLVVEVSAVVTAAAVWDLITGVDQAQKSSVNADESLHNTCMFAGQSWQDSNNSPYRTAASVTSSHTNVQQDSNSETAPGKLAALSQGLADDRRKHFASDAPHIFLHILATRPEFQRRGYAKGLCEMGIRFAKENHASLCVQTGGRGYILFSGLGFVDKGLVSIASESRTDDVLIKAMSLNPRLVQRRESLVDSLARYFTS